MQRSAFKERCESFVDHFSPDKTELMLQVDRTRIIRWTSCEPSKILHQINFQSKMRAICGHCFRYRMHNIYFVFEKNSVNGCRLALLFIGCTAIVMLIWQNVTSFFQLKCEKWNSNNNIHLHGYQCGLFLPRPKLFLNRSISCCIRLIYHFARDLHMYSIEIQVQFGEKKALRTAQF